VKHSIRIVTTALVIAGTIALLAPFTGTTALLTDRETAHVRVVGTSDLPQETGYATRTHGFWLAHPALTGHVLEEHLGGSIDCGPLVLTSNEGVLGALAADPRWDSNGDKRTRLDRARVLCTRQLVAAVLSGALSNAAPVPLDPATGVDLLAAARSALNASDARECLRIAELLDAYLQAHCEEELVLDCGYRLEADQLEAGLALANISIMDPVESESPATQSPEPSMSASQTPSPPSEEPAADAVPPTPAPAPPSEEGSPGLEAITTSVAPSPE